MPTGLTKRTLIAFLWSGAQSWGGKLLTLALFLVLARLLTPEQMGTAAAALVVVALALIVAEQGYPEAIIQRADLNPADLNLPFDVSMGTAVAASAVLVVFSAQIAHLVRVPAAEPLLVVAALIPPFGALVVFQTATRKRALDFKGPAQAGLLATLASGGLALALAFGGLGAVSLVGQAAALVVVSAGLLWARPVWRPALAFDRASYASITGYSLNAFGSRLLDFMAVRMIELIIVIRLGPVGLGFYVVGSKLHATLLQLLAGTVSEVALAALSRVSHDRDRLREGYLRFVFIASCTTMPLFVGVAALSTEICDLLFGPRWQGVAEVALWLSLLGAVQSVQFFNGAVIGATGGARMLLGLNILKAGLAAAALLLAPDTSVVALTLAFCLSQLVVTPVSFWAAWRASGATPGAIGSNLWAGAVGSALAFAAVELANQSLGTAHWASARSLPLLLGVYGTVVLAAVFLLTRGRLSSELRFIVAAARSQRQPR
jgi:O-antigen/teichoic acid export membrane protein